MIYVDDMFDDLESTRVGGVQPTQRLESEDSSGRVKKIFDVVLENLKSNGGCDLASVEALASTYNNVRTGRVGGC